MLILPRANAREGSVWVSFLFFFKGKTADGPLETDGILTEMGGRLQMRRLQMNHAREPNRCHDERFFAVSRAPLRLIDQVAAENIQRLYGNVVECVMQK